MKRMIKSALLAGILLGVFVFALAQSQSTTNAPTSPAGVNALASYKEGARKLDEEYTRRLDALRQDYIKELDKARKASLEKDELEEALRLLAEKKRIEAEKPQPGATKGLAILCALIGVEDKWIDVTSLVRGAVQNSQIHFRPDANPFMSFPDIAPGKHKSLMIAYTLDGKPFLSITRDDQAVNIP